MARRRRRDAGEPWEPEQPREPPRPRSLLDAATVDPGELGEVLAALEGLAAELAAPTLRSEGFAPLEAALDRIKQARNWGDDWDLRESHIEFHSVFFHLCGNRLLQSMWPKLESALRDQLRSLDTDPSFNPIDDHLELLNLVRRSPIDAMRREIEEHARSHFPPVTRRTRPRYHMRSNQEDEDDFGS